MEFAVAEAVSPAVEEVSVVVGKLDFVPWGIVVLVVVHSVEVCAALAVVNVVGKLAHWQRCPYYSL